MIIFLFIETCTNQKDYYDSKGNYWKTVCTLNTAQTKQSAKKACEAQNMILASADDSVDGVGILTNRANKEFTTDQFVWIGSEIMGECSVLHIASTSNYIRAWRPCESLYYAYCEFNCKCKKYKY